MSDECVFDVTKQIKAIPKGVTIERAEIHILYHSDEVDELQRKLDEAQNLARHNLEWANSLNRDNNKLQKKLDIAVEALRVAGTNLEDMKNNEANYSIDNYEDISRHTLGFIEEALKKIRQS